MNAIDSNNDDETAIQGQWLIVEVGMFGDTAKAIQ